MASGCVSRNGTPGATRSGGVTATAPGVAALASVSSFLGSGSLGFVVWTWMGAGASVGGDAGGSHGLAATTADSTAPVAPSQGCSGRGPKGATRTRLADSVERD